MAYENIAHRLAPEYPKFTETESQIGNEYKYIGDKELIADNKPEIGEGWEDGRSVTDVKLTPGLGNSSVSELTVSTVYSRTATTLANDNTPIEIRYRLYAQTSQVELAQHPAFLPGGDSDLWGEEVTSGVLTAQPVVFCMLWENEPSAEARAKRQFYRRGPDGEALSSTPIDVPSGAAQAYVKLRQMNYTVKDVYNPVFEKISTYRGDDMPGTGTWGQYMAADDAFLEKVPEDTKATYPQWIKGPDSFERIGTKARWQRTESAIGYEKVYFDVDTLNPAENTLP